MDKKIIQTEKRFAEVSVRRFPGADKLYSELSALAHRGEISDDEVVRRMKLAEAEYHGGLVV